MRGGKKRRWHILLFFWSSEILSKQEHHGSGSWEFLKITVVMLLLGSLICTEILVFLTKICPSLQVSQWLREPVPVTSEE